MLSSHALKATVEGVWKELQLPVTAQSVLVHVDGGKVKQSVHLKFCFAASGESSCYDAHNPLDTNLFTQRSLRKFLSFLTRSLMTSMKPA